MKVSYNWLKEFVDVPWGARELAERLETSGTAVESITVCEPEFSGVRTGAITAIAPHPQADKLQITTIDAGTGEMLQIVCGASNIEVGQIVPVALVGAELPGGTKIGRAQLRGVESAGMLCSETELKLGEDARGIMILDADTPIGEPLEKILNLNDTVIEFEITPNRPDCMSMIGIAREVAALTGGSVRKPAAEVKSEGKEAGIAVDITAPDLCPRYTARVIEGLRVAPAPFWLRSRLNKAGIRPINNLVDITNYVLLETGQPLHAFDREKIADRRLIVRRAADNETITTLDGVERRLQRDMLVIADGAAPAALAGVMGGAATEIADSTTDCVVESAYFEPTGIFRTSFELDLRSEASARIERGTDPNGTVYAADRAAALIVELAGGRAVNGVVDVYPTVIDPVPVTFSPAKARAILGADISDQKMLGILSSLEIAAAKPAGGEAIKVMPPTFRPDLTRGVDIVEEIARVFGFANVPATIPDAVGSAAPLTREQLTIRAARDLLSAAGLHECVNYAFIDPGDLTRLVLPTDDPRRKTLSLQNPLSVNQSVMRPTLLPGLLRTARFNAGYGNIDVQLFEIGRVFTAAGAGQMPVERNIIAGVMAGAWEEDAWYAKRRGLDFFDLKGVIEALFTGLGLNGLSIEVGDDPLYHPGQSAKVLSNGAVIGGYGLLHPSVSRNYELDGDVYAFEIEAASMAAAMGGSLRVAAPGRYPAIVRDISLFVDESTPVGIIDADIRHAAGELLADVRLFDLYAGKNVPAGRKGLGYRLTYQSAERTLTVEEAEAAHARVLRVLQEELHAQIR